MSEKGPLSISLDIAGIKTAIPLIKDGQLAKFRFVELNQTSNDKGQALQFVYELVDPVPTQDGCILNPGDFGSKFFEHIQLYAKPDAKDPEWFVKKIATRIDALLGTGDPDNDKGKPARPILDNQLVPTLVGQCLIAKVKVTTFEGQDRNEFATVYFPGDVNQG